MARYNSILETVGNTPCVKLHRLAPKDIELYVKIEAFNPMGSVKDRLAMGVIEDAERRGTLKPGQTVIEATSGNTGIGLAMVCAHKGYPLVVTMAENFSVERRKMMRFLGAKVVLTPAHHKGSGMLNKAIELAETHGWFLCRQFENEANANIHTTTTAQEILRDFADTGLDYWVTGFGTGGTLKGVARELREKSPNTQIILCEPDNSALIASPEPQSYQDDGSPAASHPAFRPHLMQGWTPDFISKLTGDAVNDELFDRLMAIKGDDALTCSKRLAQEEGIFVGISSGATLAGAIEVAREAEPGSRILCMLPDTGERYLSTPLFDDIDVEMNVEEQELSRSTPGYRFDTPAGGAPAATVAPTQAAKDFLHNLLNDKQQPVALFALEWCEFCWSLRKLFTQCGIDFRSVDLDSAENQKDNWGGQVRAALTEHSGCATIPQVFIGGEFIGGCSDTLDGFKTGELQEKLKRAGISFTEPEGLDPYSLLPKWVGK